MTKTETMPGDFAIVLPHIANLLRKKGFIGYENDVREAAKELRRLEDREVEADLERRNLDAVLTVAEKQQDRITDLKKELKMRDESLEKRLAEWSASLKVWADRDKKGVGGCKGMVRELSAWCSVLEERQTKHQRIREKLNREEPTDA